MVIIYIDFDTFYFWLWQPGFESVGHISLFLSLKNILNHLEKFVLGRLMDLYP